ncbi:MAG: binding-protein-dependent transport system inner rane component [Deltaproteobacteria bacterium]|nr:binding-protein-dependent transport system inner rane component [Deltaproteobacteria bacterium]MBP1719003.1 binding-protein-dependent transport system inner rane component [Deltaproteobacteria bacterium]
MKSKAFPSVLWFRQLLIYLCILAFLIFFLFPFAWMLIVSLKPDQELYNFASFPFWVKSPTLDHYRFLFSETSLPTWFKNSFVVALSSTAISLGVGILAAYGLARIRFRGSSGFALMIFVTYLVPTSLLFLPLSTVISLLGLANTYWALILTYPSFLIPFCTWLLLGYFKTIPLALEESAMIDGCGRFQAMVHIVLPLAVPGIVCVGLFAFTLSWQEFIYSLTFISSAGQKTLPSGIVTELVRGDVYFWGSLMSACLLGSIPIAILYSLFLDYFVAGLTAGSVKS